MSTITHPDEIDGCWAKTPSHLAVFDGITLGKLPPDGEQGLIFKILDRVTGITHDTKSPYTASYQHIEEHPDYAGDPDVVWPSGLWTVHDFMVGGKFCPHLRADACGIDMPDCQDLPDGTPRFVILSVTHPAVPNLNLYREEMPCP